MLAFFLFLFHFCITGCCVPRLHLRLMSSRRSRRSEMCKRNIKERKRLSEWKPSWSRSRVKGYLYRVVHLSRGFVLVAISSKLAMKKQMRTKKKKEKKIKWCKECQPTKPASQKNKRNQSRLRNTRRIYIYSWSRQRCRAGQCHIIANMKKSK